jgi:ribonucleoside-triphosphate reductase
VDSIKIIDSYLTKSDWRVKENSSVSFNVGALILHQSGAMTSEYYLAKVLPKEVADAHARCAIHCHDLSMIMGYCAGWSLRNLLDWGIPSVGARQASGPAKHLMSAVEQLVDFLAIMQNEWAGAQAVSSIDTLLAPFIKKDNLSEGQVKQCIQMFLYGVNSPTRWASQSPFSNITIDFLCPDDLKDKPAIIANEQLNFTYGECQPEIDLFNKCLFQAYYEGDYNGRSFIYPIPTISITKDFPYDHPNCEWLFKTAAKNGVPYFSNYVSSDLSPSDVRSMCLTGDTKVFAWEKVKGYFETTIQDLLENYNLKDIKIRGRKGYRFIKRKIINPFKGNLIKITTESGKSLSMTPDHPHLIYSIRGKTKKGSELTSIKIVQAKDLKEGMLISLTSRKSIVDANIANHRNTLSAFYGEERSKTIKENIGKGSMGHFVSENCKKASSERWEGLNNPVKKQNYWDNNKTGANLSPYEFEFEEELKSLELDFIHQYLIKGTGKETFTVDFYIPSKNLAIELEANKLYSEKAYFNDSINQIASSEIKNRYAKLRQQGVNVLYFNPKTCKDDYRPFINKTEKIIKIEQIPFDGLVYDVEVDNTGCLTEQSNFYANDILTHNCCRLRLDLRELRKKMGGFFGSGDSTGSVSVTTLNLPRLAYETVQEGMHLFREEIFWKNLDKLLELAYTASEVRRTFITSMMEQGLYPYTSYYLGSLDNHFSTIGLVGMHEMLMNLFGRSVGIQTKEGHAFAIKVLDHMREKCSEFQVRSGNLYNLEATPAESTCYRFAKHDVADYPDIITAGKPGAEPYYTNSSNLPVGFTFDIFKALENQEELQTRYTGGVVFHIFLNQSLESWEIARDLIKKVTSISRLPYFTLSPSFSVCSVHGFLKGEHKICPICAEEQAIEYEKKLKVYEQQLAEQEEEANNS